MENGGKSSSSTNSIGMEFVPLAAGRFWMGEGHASRAVNISRPFYMGKYPVTQTQWQTVMGANPSHFKGENHPVDSVSWDDAQAFIRALNAREGHSRYSLPTAAQWEYACRAGSETAWCCGNDWQALKEYAWYIDNAGRHTHPVGQKRANAWGLHDMHGNVLEWVQDSDHTGLFRVQRGGSYLFHPGCCRSSDTFVSTPDRGSDFTGFRLALAMDGWGRRALDGVLRAVRRVK